MRYFFLLCLCTAVTALSAQGMNAKKNLAELRRTKTILGLTGDPIVDDALRTAVDSFYTLSRVVEELPYKEALKKARSDKQLSVLYLRRRTSKINVSRPNPGTIGSPVPRMEWVPGASSSAMIVTVTSGKRGDNGDYLFTFIPLTPDGQLTPAIVHFGVATLQDMGKTMQRAKGKVRKHYLETLAKRGRRLRTKTLYVLEDWLGKKLSADQLAEIYGYPVEVVPYEAFSDVVLRGKEGDAYSMVTPLAANGTLYYAHYLVDAHTGQTLQVVAPKVGVSLGPINLSKKSKPYVNENMAEAYHEAVSGRR